MDPRMARRRAPLGDFVTDVTGFISSFESRLQAVEQELTRVDHAIAGGAAGAQAGYNAPVNMNPWLVGGAVLAGLWLLGRK